MMVNELIEIDDYSPLRAERYMDMILFYVGPKADSRYSHDNRGRPTTERQELGSGNKIRSIINPLGIRMNDIDIIMNSGVPEQEQNEWDGRYILFEDGGTFTTGKTENYFEAESFEADLDYWSPEKDVIEQIKYDSRLKDEFPLIDKDSNWDSTKINEWTPERQTIEEIRGNREYRDMFPMLGSHPGHYDNSGYWVEHHNEYKEYYTTPQLPIWAQILVACGASVGFVYLAKKLDNSQEP